MLCPCPGFVFKRLQFAPLPAASRLPVSLLTLSRPGLAPEDPGIAPEDLVLVQNSAGEANNRPGLAKSESGLAQTLPGDPQSQLELAPNYLGHVFSCSGQIFLQ